MTVSKHAGTIIAVILVVLVVGGIAYYMSMRAAPVTTAGGTAGSKSGGTSGSKQLNTGVFSGGSAGSK